MPTEGATKIDELDPARPTGSEGVGEGDDHLRQIKAATKNTFPNFGANTDSGIVTLEADQINGLPQANDDQDAARDSVITELLKHVVPIGTINMWSGSNATIPPGWALCDGTGGNNNLGDPYTTPDLRNKFIAGSGDTYVTGDTGGDASVSSSAAGGHDHGGSTASVALTLAQIPAHSHTMFNSTENPGGAGDPLPTVNQYVAGDGRRGGGDRQYVVMASVNGAPDSGKTGEAGSGAAHSHDISSVADHTHTVATIPPFYALAFIMKVDGYDDPLAP